MPDPREALDIAAALHALAALLDEDRPMPGLACVGIGVLLAQLAARADALGAALWDVKLAA